MIETNKTKNLQGQGEEISLHDNFMSEVQRAMDNPTQDEVNIFDQEDTKAREETKGGFNLAEDLVDFGVNPDDNLIDIDKNKSAPRHHGPMPPGYGQRARPFGHPSHVMPSGAYGGNNLRTPVGGLGNFTNKMGGNFGERHSYLGPQKMYNSVHKGNLGPMGDMNLFQKTPVKKDSGMSPFSFDKPEDSKNYVSEDWFEKIDKKDTIRATDGTKEVQSPEINEQNSFLIELTQDKESEAPEIDSSLADLIDMSDSQSKQKSQPEPQMAPSEEDPFQDSKDFQKQLVFLEKQKEIAKEVRLIPNL